MLTKISFILFAILAPFLFLYSSAKDYEKITEGDYCVTYFKQIRPIIWSNEPNHTIYKEWCGLDRIDFYGSEYDLG